MSVGQIAVWQLRAISPDACAIALWLFGQPPPISRATTATATSNRPGTALRTGQLGVSRPPCTWTPVLAGRRGLRFPHKPAACVGFQQCGAVEGHRVGPHGGVGLK